MSLINADVAAEMLHVSVKTIHRYINSGKLKGYRFGRAYKIEEESVKELIEKSKIGVDEHEHTEQ